MPLQSSRRILGLMSGTSLDGLDIALCKISGSGLQTQLEVQHFVSAPYSVQFKTEIRSVFSQEQVSLQKLTILNEWIPHVHGDMIMKALLSWGLAADEIDCIASHGQTVYHAPRRLHGLEGYPDATLQIGDGDHLAVKTGIITISDFRQKHVAAGGEGAPLALYGDLILFSSANENRVLLNIGGISNFTYLPADQDPQGVLCSDTGPGNTLSDKLCQTYFGRHYDEEGAIARSGRINQNLLQALRSHPFFQEGIPKTTGPELFNLSFLEAAKLEASISNIAPEDLLATVSELTAWSVANAVERSLGDRSYSVYVSGGGCHNTFLMEKLRKYFSGRRVRQTEELGFNADAKEAALFALLANETICGSAIRSGAGPAVTMGKISLPF